MGTTGRRRAAQLATLGTASIALIASMASPALGTATTTPDSPDGRWDKTSTTTESTTVSWKEVEGAQYYLCDGTATTSTTCSHEGAPDTIHRFHIQACNADGCSPSTIVATATNPLPPSKVRIRKVKQQEAGGDRCVRLAWRASTAGNHYWINVQNEAENTSAGAIYRKNNRGTVCGLDPQSEFTFNVEPINRLTKNAVGNGITLTGAASPDSRTLGAVPGVPGKTKIIPLNAEEANPAGVGVNASIPSAIPGATYYAYQALGQFLPPTSPNTNLDVLGFQWNATVQVQTKACNTDGCSALGPLSDKDRTAPYPQIWNITSSSKNTATFTTQGMRGGGGYSYRIKWCDRTKNKGCDAQTDADGQTGWITERNADTRNIGGLTSGNKYAFAVVTSPELDGSKPRTYSTTKTVTIT